MIPFYFIFISLATFSAFALAGLPGGNCVGTPVAVSRAPNVTDVFVIASDGLVYTASLLPGDTVYNGYWNLPGFRASACNPIAAVSRATDKLDIFAIGTDSKIFQSSWEPDLGCENVIDLFAVGTDNIVWTSGWTPESEWGTWRSIRGISLPGAAPISATSREEDFLDIFAVDTAGDIWTAAWQPGDASWAGWWSVAGGRASPGASVSSVSRSKDHLDIFVVNVDDGIYTAAWQPGFNGFQGWWPAGESQLFQPVSPITAISRAPDVLSVFALDSNFGMWWTSWSPSSGGWSNWTSIEAFYPAATTALSAVSMAPDRIDIFGGVTFENGACEIDSWISKSEESKLCWQSDIMQLPTFGCPYY